MASAALGVVFGASRARSQSSFKSFPLASSSLVLDVAETGDALVAVGDRGFILRSTDMGSSWVQMPSPAGVMLTGVAFAGPSGLAVGHDATILRSTDAGLTWQTVSSDPDAETPLLGVVCDGPDRALAYGAYGLLMESTDGGASWSERRITDDEPHLYRIAKAVDGAWYAAGEFGSLFASADAGATWTPIDSSPYDGSYFGLLALADGGLLLFGLRGNLFRSDDGAATWTAVETGTTATLHGGVQRKSGDVVIVGLSGSVLTSADGRDFDLRGLSDREALTGAVETADGSMILFGERGVRRFDPAQLPTVPRA
ncbi:MAG: YCF48-related protein [Rhodospirillaceae bacterium]|nr:YCF48-related protein [Rhodospirillaceae bacterium]